MINRRSAVWYTRTPARRISSCRGRHCRPAVSSHQELHPVFPSIVRCLNGPKTERSPAAMKNAVSTPPRRRAFPAGHFAIALKELESTRR